MDSQRAIAPVVTGVAAPTNPQNDLVMSNELHPAGNGVGRAQQVVPGGLTPAFAGGLTQVVASPAQPLFDEQQLRRFQELHNQAPWLYLGGKIMVPPMQVQPPLARLIFLDQEERRLQGILIAGEKPPVAYPYMVPPSLHENVELRKGSESVMEEHRKLRARIELFENSNGEEDPKFSTPTGEVKEAETPKEAVRPPREGLGSNRSSLEIETPKDAVRPPKGSLKPQDSDEAETTKEAVCLESCKNFKDAETTKEAARPPKSAVQDPKDWRLKVARRQRDPQNPRPLHQMTKRP